MLLKETSQEDTNHNQTEPNQQYPKDRQDKVCVCMHQCCSQ